MRVIEILPDFPAKQPPLRGLNLEAYQVLQDINKATPVLKIDPQGQNVAAVKRAFARAARELHGSVRSQNSEDGMILVKWQAIPKRTAAAAPKARLAHSQQSVDQEMRRLNPGYEKLDPITKKRLETSAKRNLPRRAAIA